MKHRNVVVCSLALASVIAAIGHTQAQQKPGVKIPEPGVPQVMTLEGTYVRAAYNNEGYAILGYRVANLSVGDEWMLLDFGVTVRSGVPDYVLTRDAVSLETPDGKTLPLPSVAEYRGAHLQALEQRAKVTRDSIDYWPPGVNKPCRIGFFAEPNAPRLAWDQVELSDDRGCVGRLYFHVPGGIAYGQHWLNVKLAKTMVRVPFRILTKEEDKLLSKNYKDIRKQVEEAFRVKS